MRRLRIGLSHLEMVDRLALPWIAEMGLSQTIRAVAPITNWGALDFQTPAKVVMTIVRTTQLWHIAPTCRLSEVKIFLFPGPFCTILCRFVSDYRVGMAPDGAPVGHIPDRERS